ncbi:MAG: Malate synthase, partial [uncultured Solirubrobacteraceae bacterium]
EHPRVDRCRRAGRARADGDPLPGGRGLRHGAPRPLRGPPPGPARGPPRAPPPAPRGRRPGLPALHARGARGLVDGGAAARGLPRPPGRDHGADGSQARHQRAQLGRPGLHGRLRGRELPHLGQPGLGTREPRRRHRGDHRLRELGRPPVRARRQPGDAPRPPARLAPGGEAPARRRRARRRRARRLRALRLPRGPAAAGPGVGAVPLPAQARAPPRGPAVERRLHLDPGRARAPVRLHPGHGAHRDPARGVPDGGDPLRAARPLLRPQRGPLGLHLLDDQVLPRAAGVR